MQFEKLNFDFTVCKIADASQIDLGDSIYFIGKTDEEISLVCITENTPAEVLEREDGWRAFRVKGVLDFSLIGVLAKISNLLAENGIGIFVVSTYNTDYVLVKKENFNRAMEILNSQM